MEKLDVYDINGNKTGKIINRGEKTSEGEYIKLVIVYLKAKGYYLMQKCSVQKGGEYAITGGHVSSGNTCEQQCVIEVQEELGLNIQPNKLQYLGNIFRGKAIFEVYLYEDDSLLDFDFVLQEEEVESVNWLTKQQIVDLINQGVVRESSVMHFNKYIK